MAVKFFKVSSLATVAVSAGHFAKERGEANCFI